MHHSRLSDLNSAEYDGLVLLVSLRGDLRLARSATVQLHLNVGLRQLHAWRHALDRERKRADERRKRGERVRAFESNGAAVSLGATSLISFPLLLPLLSPARCIRLHDSVTLRTSILETAFRMST